MRTTKTRVDQIESNETPNTGGGGRSNHNHPMTVLSRRLLLTATEAAGILRISRAHFYRMHNAGRIPQPIRLGGCVRWRVDELNAWIEAGMPNRQRWLAMKGGA